MFAIKEAKRGLLGEHFLVKKKGTSVLTVPFFLTPIFISTKE